MLIEDASDTYVFRDNYLKYSFLNFLSIFSSLQCLYVVRYIVLSSSYDDEISVETPCDVRLIVSKGGTNSADLDPLDF